MVFASFFHMSAECGFFVFEKLRACLKILSRREIFKMFCSQNFEIVAEYGVFRQALRGEEVEFPEVKSNMYFVDDYYADKETERGNCGTGDETSPGVEIYRVCRVYGTHGEGVDGASAGNAQSGRIAPCNEEDASLDCAQVGWNFG